MKIIFNKAGLQITIALCKKYMFMQLNTIMIMTKLVESNLHILYNLHFASLFCVLSALPCNENVGFRMGWSYDRFPV